MNHKLLVFRIEYHILIIIMFIFSIQNNFSQNDSVVFKHPKKHSIGIEGGLFSNVVDYETYYMDHLYVLRNKFDFNYYYGFRYKREFSKKFLFDVGIGLYSISLSYEGFSNYPYSTKYEYTNDSNLIIKNYSSYSRSNVLHRYLILSFGFGKMFSMISKNYFTKLVQE